MQFGRLVRPLALSCFAVVLIPVSPTPVRAQGHDTHAGSVSESRKPTREQNELVKTVQDATRRFKNVSSVEGPGEGFTEFCISIVQEIPTTAEEANLCETQVSRHLLHPALVRRRGDPGDTDAPSCQPHAREHVVAR